jgi:hypothetical protein
MAIDPQSATWRAVAAWANEGIEDMRLELEREGTNPARSEYLRGQISARRHLLEQGAPRFNPDVRQPNYSI